MRDGEYVGTLVTKDTTKDEIVKMMVGRVIYGDKKAGQHGSGGCGNRIGSQASEQWQYHQRRQF